MSAKETLRHFKGTLEEPHKKKNKWSSSVITTQYKFKNNDNLLSYFEQKRTLESQKKKETYSKTTEELEKERAIKEYVTKYLREIEAKFRESKTNATYVFPRELNGGESEDSSSESLDSIRSATSYQLSSQNEGIRRTSHQKYYSLGNKGKNILKEKEREDEKGTLRSNGSDSRGASPNRELGENEREISLPRNKENIQLMQNVYKTSPEKNKNMILSPNLGSKTNIIYASSMYKTLSSQEGDQVVVRSINHPTKGGSRDGASSNLSK